MVFWKQVTDLAKRRPLAMRVADRLGRGVGRYRFLDRMHRPRPSPHRPDLSRWNDAELAALWIGHATVLIRLGGKTILTDPAFGNRIGLGLGLATAGPARWVAPALSIAQLPPIDLILISHAHFDHLDRPTLARLPKQTPVLTPKHTRDLIADLGFGHLHEVAWGDTQQFGGLKVTSWEVNHWGARTFVDQHRQVCAYLLEAGNRRVVFGGDTAMGDHFKTIGPVDLAILGIGAYNPYVAAHATPEQAWRMASDMPAGRLLAMHHSTFRLSHEPMHEPMQRLLAVAGKEKHRIVGSEIGKLWICP